MEREEIQTKIEETMHIYVQHQHTGSATPEEKKESRQEVLPALFPFFFPFS